ncbi:hypothetical protein H4582DRAFT_1893782 [Lactarius indigo]|nr:hypothetical protein H4582DRAFT_1893782 [Lactarius indigo]
MNSFRLFLSLLLSLRRRPIGYSDEELPLSAEGGLHMGNIACSDNSYPYTYWLGLTSLRFGNLSASSRGSRSCGTRAGIKGDCRVSYRSRAIYSRIRDNLPMHF